MNMKNAITYENRNGYLYPLLALSKTEEAPIGKYGRMYLDYLKKHRRGTYTTLLTENRLNEHLHRVDFAAREAVLKITEELATARGIDEHLKIAEPIRWVQEMNVAKHDAEKIVLQVFYEQIR